jgi:hypothetical protein
MSASSMILLTSGLISSAGNGNTDRGGCKDQRPPQSKHGVLQPAASGHIQPLPAAITCHELAVIAAATHAGAQWYRSLP